MRVTEKNRTEGNDHELQHGHLTGREVEATADQLRIEEEDT
jgi:hypothetical protein